MSEKYDEYLDEHKANVIKGFEWLKENLPEIFEDDLDIYEEHMKRHDLSKYVQDEYDPYDKYFYGKNKSFEVVENFNKAWLHHIHNNRHHWQHWVLINDDPDKGEIILDMPELCIIEMICDWWSFSWKQGKLDEIFKWYDEHSNYMKLSKSTRGKVNHILSKIQLKLLYESDADETN